MLVLRCLNILIINNPNHHTNNGKSSLPHSQLISFLVKCVLELTGEDVVACDMTNVPLGDQEVDAVVFSLSLMGSNHVGYLKEGFRILKPYGSLFICEPKKKAESRMENLKKEIEDCGFKIIDVKPSSQFVYINAVKMWFLQ